MGGYHTEYKGGDYGFEPKYSDEFIGYRASASSISLNTDPRVANQIKATTEKLNAGATAIEINMVMSEVAESIPNQHLEELNRLRKITGSEFTVHGALVEPTGVTRRGWDETQRQQAERQMWTSLSRAQKVNTDGNVVVTFHSSNGLPEPETKVIDQDTNQERVTGMIIVDERTGEFGQVATKDYRFPGQPTSALDEIKKQNEESWLRELNQVNFHAYNGESIVREVLSSKDIDTLEKLKGKEVLKEIYKDYAEGNKEKAMKKLGEDFVQYQPILDQKMSQMTHGDIYLRDAYRELKSLYEKAYDAAKRNNLKDDLKKLDKFADEIAPKVEKLENDFSKVDELAEVITKGVSLLRSVKTPQTFKPLKEFAIEEASKTFSNLAVRDYDEFERKGQHAPIISIENPPAGSGLSRAEDLKLLIEKSREKFTEKAVREFGLSEKQAKQEAEKLIGATWDLGHINMIRKFGYGDDTLVQESKKIAPYVKNIHLSDNFGMEHTELPMGMGNVPTKKHMEMLKRYNDKIDEIKKVVETAQWYQHFQTTPFGETLSAFGSPVYAMQLSPSWNQVYGRSSAQYFAGYGLNPDIHHTIYGSGFSGLPLELGGQVAGRSRFSGTSME